MFARFFIDRPIFAWVVSLVILLVGGVAAFSLPIEMYPNITPPTVQVTASYPGANAQVVANTVAAPIEQQVNGVERMLYMSSQSTNDGNYTLTVTFEIGTDVNIAQVLVQNRVALALPQLPPQVQLEGVNTKKASPDILLVINLLHPTAATTASTSAISPPSRSRTNCRASKESATSRSSASAITACASGSTRTSWPRAT